ncbi:uncharacterized protein LOC100575789 isoform X2 [Acyrthosiphon pisum]|uniref:BACK domain-containing protein n=1 Tax=Acyrthosiphon pisum TaxID=7029 RepID=A0A8R2H774_ACYPI|nr:uncharacterized protein LOC100575789 isoform X2 [Acyrthosiphon pisum]|eukprot:XP_016658823.1 PREDICTED: uncharacterized protein LOC100575789 isoform X2 [Acyrthosiphon pisum]
MFSNFDENYIYTEEIMATKENDQVDYVSSACAEFLRKQQDISNCINIKAFANLHNYTGLLSSSEAFIKQHFSEVAKAEDFLFSSSGDLVKLISSNDCCSI